MNERQRRYLETVQENSLRLKSLVEDPSSAGTDVTITAHQNGAYSVRVDVSDSDMGIQKDDQSNLFTKFFRADNSAT